MKEGEITYEFFKKELVKSFSRVTKWWERLVLSLIPTHYTGDSDFGIYYKRWRGRIYVIKVNRGQAPHITILDDMEENNAKDKG